MSAQAPLADVFASFQGEGPLAGVCQLFVRVRGCDLTCRYCDTPAARDTTGPCRVEWTPGSGQWEEGESPLSAERVVKELVAPFLGLPLHSLALTGGEPLLYPGFVGEAACLANERGLPVYLETGGHKPRELSLVKDLIRYVSLDFKLPSTLAVSVDQSLFVDSYAVALGRVVAVKMVVTADVGEAEVAEACRALARVSDAGPVVLQPVTRVCGGPEPPSVERLFALHRAASEHIRDVRVVPQCHRALGVL